MTGGREKVRMMHAIEADGELLTRGGGSASGGCLGSDRGALWLAVAVGSRVASRSPGRTIPVTRLLSMSR